MTDQITVSRELLRQVLDETVVTSEMIKAYTELRTALEQPAVEPVAWRWAYKGQPDSDKCFPMPVPDQDVQDVVKMRAFPRTVQLLYAAPPAQQPQLTVHSHTVRTLPNGDTEGFAFATSPEIRQPQLLTDEEIDGIVRSNEGTWGADFGCVARAIERAVLRKNGIVK